ncbi:MAG TPA: xanthine dehydrogenase family protein subunit M [Ramlibacter sp.]|nr:xanthine dehydrogenase family protein subunit M [Ramlibacter sp.]
MKPAAFAYEAPRTVDEVLGILAEHGDEAKLLAGGQSLVPMLNFRLMRPALLVDINRVQGVSAIEPQGGGLTVGAMTRQGALERSSAVARAFPLLAEALPLIAHFQIRNRGTIGGSLSHADPAAELPAVMTALGAQLVLRSRRAERTVTCDQFFKGYLETDLAADEMLVRIQIPPDPARSGSAFLEVSQRHGDFALVGVAVRLTLDAKSACAAASIVLTGVDTRPLRASEAERALVGSRLSEDDLRGAAALAAKNLAPQSDMHASADYRTDAARALTARALAAALGRARTTRQEPA